jgi:hypothetical protein
VRATPVLGVARLQGVEEEGMVGPSETEVLPLLYAHGGKAGIEGGLEGQTGRSSVTSESEGTEIGPDTVIQKEYKIRFNFDIVFGTSPSLTTSGLTAAQGRPPTRCHYYLEMTKK